MNVDDLIEIEAIKRLKYRYVRCLDLKEWDDLASCLTEDATSSYGGGKYAFDGRDAIVAFLRDALGAGTMLTQHHVHQPEIEVDGDTATGRWALHDTVIDTSHQVTIRGAAFYDDSYLKRNGEWRISSTGYRRLFEEIQDRSQQSGLTLTEAWTKTQPSGG